MIRSGDVCKKDKLARACQLRLNGGLRTVLFMILVGVVCGILLGACGHQKLTLATPGMRGNVDELSSALQTQCKTPEPQTASEFSWPASSQTPISATFLPAYEIAVADGAGVRLKTIVTR